MTDWAENEAQSSSELLDDSLSSRNEFTVWETTAEWPLRGVKKISKCIMITVQQIGKGTTTTITTKCHQHGAVFQRAAAC